MAWLDPRQEERPVFCLRASTRCAILIGVLLLSSGVSHVREASAWPTVTGHSDADERVLMPRCRTATLHGVIPDDATV